MNTQNIVDMIYRLTNVDASQYTEDNAINDLNLIYQDLIDTIVTDLNADYFWDTGTKDLILGQNEYTLNTLAGLTDSDPDLDIKKINKLFIRYNTNDAYFTRVEYRDPLLLDKDLSYYGDEQSEIEPFYFIKDKSVFIYPTPTVNVSNGLEAYVIYTPSDLTINSTELDIKIPRQFHHLIPIGVKQFVYSTLDKLNEKNDSINEYEKLKREMIIKLDERSGEPTFTTPPSLTYLE